MKFGTWLSIGSPVIAELAAQSGFDWLLIDLEHGCGNESAILPQLQAIRGSEVKGVVRVGAPYPDLIARTLDWGAHGIMVPHVNSADEAEGIVKATRYSPRGSRGYSRTVRANDYGMRPIEEVPPPIVMAQIETIEGVNHASEIAAVDGIDVLFIGPSDMRYDLQQRAEIAPGDFDFCVAQVVEAARDAGKDTGILARDPGDVKKFQDLGFKYIAVDSDLAILRKSYLATTGK
ncbi:aldolase/citrate lyase family protein [Verrucomicrobiales bacterium BCK34]|nr:aldolase/citrate lyase family protein [Verrucomicrobiales bacterium BCK34]